MDSATRRRALSPQPDPLGQRLRFPFRSLEYDLGSLLYVWYGHFAAAQPANEANYGRPGGAAAVHGRSNFRRNNATQVRRTEREVAIDHSDGFETLQALGNLRTGKRPEPAQTDEPDFLALFAHLPDCHLDRRRQCAHAQQYDFRIFGHIFFEKWIAVF